MTFDKRTNRNEYFARMERELSDLLDPATGQVRADLIEHTDCPVCRGSTATPFVEKWGFQYARCPDCSVVFVNPRLIESKVIELYKRDSVANEMWAKQVIASPGQQQFYKDYFAEQRMLLERFKGSGALLDVGCGNGDFLVDATASFECIGLELEEGAVQIARSRGLMVRESLLTDPFLQPESFDVVTMFGVLEHLYEPVRDLQRVCSLLKRDGVYFAITPNYRSLVGILLTDQSRFYTPRNHPVIYDFSSVRYLLERNGFEVLHLDTVLSGYDSIINALQLKEPFGDEELTFEFVPEPLRALLQNKEEFERWLWANHLGLRLRVIARKV